MAIVIVVLIEFNERRKAKKSDSPEDGLSAKRSDSETVCQSEGRSEEDCSGCGLADACEKKSRNP